MVKHFPKILASEKKATMKLKVIILSGKSQTDALVHDINIKLPS